MRRDAALALALLAGATAEILLRDVRQAGLQIGISAALAGSLLLRRDRLYAALAIQTACFSLLAALAVEPAAVAAIPPLLICVFAAGSTLPTRGSVIAVAAVSAAVFVSSLVEEDAGDAFYVTTVFVLPAWFAGRLMGGRRRQVEELERLNADLAAERARTEALAAEAERVRIAREMHDVLSHGMSLMVLQAGAGPRLVESDPEAARAAFRSIRQTGERAREELGAALSDRAEGESLPSLVAAVPGARLEAAGDVESLPPGVRLAVRRIVQESLTNAVKHGGGAIVVEVACDEGAVEIAVRDDGARAAPGAGGAGRGLVGMRERVAAYGGTLHAGARPGGGFEVRARIPAHPG